MIGGVTCWRQMRSREVVLWFEEWSLVPLPAIWR